MAFAFLGNISAELSEKALEALGEIDILFVPSNDIANKLVKSVDPKIVIPGWGDPKKVMADIGQKPDPQEKLVIKKKDFEEIEGLRLIVLKN
ncbi:MAG: MBL fold metallo-hydrolase [Candidatus Colwellbacteria bacterium]|nr:MBL fold metallo-hydrolase [Candidatus Colwellbacteria bacterium]